MREQIKQVKNKNSQDHKAHEISKYIDTTIEPDEDLFTIDDFTTNSVVIEKYIQELETILSTTPMDT